MAAIRKFTQRIISTAKQFGLAAVLETFLDILLDNLNSSKKYIFFALDIKDFIVADRQFPGIDFSIVRAHDLEQSVIDPSFELTEQFLVSERDTKVVTARDNSSRKLLAYGFFCSKQVAIKEDTIFEPPANSIYLYKFFVIPEYRGRQILRALVAKVIEAQPRDNIFYVIAIIISTNFISQRAFYAMGFQRQFWFLVKGAGKALIRCERVESPSTENELFRRTLCN